MKLVVTVLVVFLILAILYFIIDYFTGKAVKLTHIRKSPSKKVIGKRKLKNSNSQNFTFSVWFYVDDWSKNYGQRKPLLTARTETGKTPLNITMGAEVNDLDITTECYTSTGQASTPGGSTNSKTCTLQNFPLQKWVNLIISVYGRTLDVYIDGKLVRTCVLPGPVAVDGGLGQVVLTPAASFTGQTADLTYWSTATNPQQAYNIYASGFGAMGSNFFNKYKIKVAFLENGQEDWAFEI